MTVAIERDAVVLFQGDSITHAFRNEEDAADLGRGYAVMVAGALGARYPDLNLRFLNRGICGDTVRQLRERWEPDCIRLAPTWVSVLIGINDTWRRFDSAKRHTTAEEYEEGYRSILEETQAKIGAKLILCEPFLLPYSDDYLAWREDLNPKIEVVRKLAREFGAPLVPLDGLFAQACAKREPGYWSWDGVHVYPTGHGLIARAWLDSVGAE